MLCYFVVFCCSFFHFKMFAFLSSSIILSYDSIVPTNQKDQLAKKQETKKGKKGQKNGKEKETTKRKEEDNEKQKLKKQKDRK